MIGKNDILRDLDLHVSSFYYHTMCLNSLKQQFASQVKAQESDPSNGHDTYQSDALEKVAIFVKENVIRDKKVYLLSDIHEIYCESCIKISNQTAQAAITFYRQDYLFINLQKRLNDKLESIMKNKKTYIYNRALTF